MYKYIFVSEFKGEVLQGFKKGGIKVPEDNNAGTIGYKLKKAREKKGYSLEDIQNITKLRMKYIKAIEENDFSVFSGDIYAKGSIRNYAKIVGLDPGELLEEYDIYHKIDEVAEDEEGEGEGTIEKTTKKPLTKPIGEGPVFTEGLKRKLIILLVIGVLVAGVWGGYRFVLSIDIEAEPEEQNGVVEEEIDEYEENDEELKDKEIALNDKEKNDKEDKEVHRETDDEVQIEFHSVVEGDDWDRYNYIVSGVDEMELEGTVVGDRCWLGNFVIDGEYEGARNDNYTEGEGFSFSASEEVQLVVGVPTLLELTVNEREIDFISQIEAEGRSVTSPIYINLVNEDATEEEL